MIDDRLPLTGALASAFGSAASWFCCLPIAAGAFGTGSAALANVVGPWRPYLIGLSVVLLGFAFYQAYRPEKSDCGPGESCPPDRTRRRGRLFLWLAVVLAAGLFSLPYWSSWVIYWTL